MPLFLFKNRINERFLKRTVILAVQDIVSRAVVQFLGRWWCCLLDDVSHYFSRYICTKNSTTLFYYQ